MRGYFCTFLTCGRSYSAFHLCMFYSFFWLICRHFVAQKWRYDTRHMSGYFCTCTQSAHSYRIFYLSMWSFFYPSAKFWVSSKFMYSQILYMLNFGCANAKFWVCKMVDQMHDSFNFALYRYFTPLKTR